MERTGVVGLIPARWASSRLPGKPLRQIMGKSMIQRVYERARQAAVLEDVCVATDDDRIHQAVLAFGGHCVMTSARHPSGTDRIAEAVDTTGGEFVVNIQGDQPFIDAAMIDATVTPLLADPSLVMSTVVHALKRSEDLHNPAVVKAVVDQQGFAMYFSRSLIPYPQNDVRHAVYEHVGLYVYRREFLKLIASLEPTLLERIESLEQLRVLESGYRIRVVEAHSQDHEFTGFSVDTSEDLARAEEMLRERGLE